MALHHIDKEYFRKAFQIADPKLTVPCNKSLTRDINTLYDADRKKLAKAILKVDHICTTGDLWTSYHKSYLGMTIHWFDPDTLQRKNDVLSCVRVLGSKTFDVIAGHMKTSMDSVGARGKINVTVVDGGKNIRKAIR